MLGAPAAVAASSALALPAAAQETTSPRIHRVTQTTPFPVNAYIVEGTDGLVVIDSLLTVAAAAMLRERVDAIGKPLRAALLTHPHPDHYAGLETVTRGLEAPILSVPGVNEVVRRDDAAKDALIGGMFGPEWPATRTFPTDTVIEGAQLDFGPGLVFSVMDIGPAESFHDSVFLLDGPRPVAFAGDLAYGLMHPYMADNTNPDWRAALDRLRRELAEDLPLYIGHGAPVTTGFLDWQETYLDLFEAAIRNADWSDGDAATAAVMRRMKDYLPSDDLVFLAQLSVLPNAKRLGML
jgi:glyoxylase-like metal-dependent hydrolase (beta-lactamase superfamily II)